MLDEQQLGDFFAQHFTRTAWRLELLPAYAVGTDGGDFQRWLDGAPEPMWSRKNMYLDALREDAAAGRSNARVKVMSAQPTDYERYACEWGYALNVKAGEDVRILDLAVCPLPGLLDGIQDFWLLDSTHVLVMHYDEHGRFEGGSVAEPGTVGRYQRARAGAVAASQPFQSWWARHPELRRSRRAA